MTHGTEFCETRKYSSKDPYSKLLASHAQASMVVVWPHVVAERNSVWSPSWRVVVAEIGGIDGLLNRRVHRLTGQTPNWPLVGVDAYSVPRICPRADCLGDRLNPRTNQLRAEWMNSRGTLPRSTGFSPMNGPFTGIAH